MTEEHIKRTPRGRRPIETNDAAITTLHNQGSGLRAIEAALGISRSTVARRLKRLGLEPHRPMGIVRQKPQQLGHKSTQASCAAGCGRFAGRSGYCGRCRQRIKRHGDPTVVLPRGRPARARKGLQ